MTWLFMTAVATVVFSFAEVEQKINNGLDKTAFEQIIAIQKANTNVYNDEAVTYDNEGDLVTLTQKDGIQFEYIRRSRQGEKDVYAKVATLYPNWLVEVSKLFKNS